MGQGRWELQVIKLQFRLWNTLLHAQENTVVSALAEEESSVSGFAYDGMSVHSLCALFENHHKAGSMYHKILL